MSWLHDHPGEATLFAFTVAGGVVAAIASSYGLEAFGDVWSHLHYGWLGLAIATQLLAIPAYVVAYRTVTQVPGGRPMPVALTVRMVTAGFGPFAVQGGFSLDKHALHAIHDDEHEATVRVLGLGALEWVLLAAAAWGSAVALLADGHSGVVQSLVWPWAIVVPVGFALGLSLSAPGLRAKIAAGEEGWRQRLALLLHGVGVLHLLGRDVRTSWRAWLGGALYWVFEITCFYAAVRFVGLHIGLGQTILAYATGYALTRRSTPLGGAGATEVLMTFSLHWVGQPIVPALAAVVVYRAFNFALPTIPALLARARIGPLLNAGYERRAAAEWEHRRASAPFGMRRR